MKPEFYLFIMCVVLFGAAFIDNIEPSITALETALRMYNK